MQEFKRFEQENAPLPIMQETTCTSNYSNELKQFKIQIANLMNQNKKLFSTLKESSENRKIYPIRETNTETKPSLQYG